MNPSESLNVLDSVLSLLKQAALDIRNSLLWIFLTYLTGFLIFNTIKFENSVSLFFQLGMIDFCLPALILMLITTLARRKLYNLLKNYCLEKGLDFKANMYCNYKYLFYVFLFFAFIINITLQPGIVWICIPIWNVFVMPVGKVGVLRSTNEQSDNFLFLITISLITAVALQFIILGISKVFGSIITNLLFKVGFNGSAVITTVALVLCMLPIYAVYWVNLAAQLSFLIYLELPHKLLNISSANTKERVIT